MTQGELAITDSLAINGRGANLLTIDASGNDPTPDTNNGDGSRVFNIDDGSFLNVLEVSISGLMLTGGDLGGSLSGGAIRSLENLAVTGSTISGNSAADGGGIFTSANATITDSTVSGNSVTRDGGGISSSQANLTVTGSTISGNSAGNNGGGIWNVLGNVTVVGSTVSGNSAGGDGGGIRHFGSSLALLLSHTIVAGNTRGASEANDVTGGGIVAFSLIGVDTGATITDNGGNLIGTAAAPIDPLLGPLADNGGPTMTHALLAGSPAINRGDLTALAGVGGVPEFDQRGAPFGRVFNGRIDIGAFELQPMPAAYFGHYNQDNVVDTGNIVMWRRTFGTSSAPAYSGADGNGDGTIDDGDYDAWWAHFGETLGSGAAVGSAAPEIGALADRQAEPDLPLLWPVSDRATGPTVGLRGAAERETFGPRAVRGQETRAEHDDALIAWLAALGGDQK